MANPTRMSDHDLAVKFLQARHSTLWGRSWDVRSESIHDAADWFLKEMADYQRFKINEKLDERHE